MNTKILKKVVTITAMATLVLTTTVTGFGLNKASFLEKTKGRESLAKASVGNEPVEVENKIPLNERYVVNLEIKNNNGSIELSKEIGGEIDTVLLVDEKTNVFRDGKKVSLSEIKKSNLIKFQMPEIITMQFPARFYTDKIEIIKKDEVKKNYKEGYIVKRNLRKGMIAVSDKKRGEVVAILVIDKNTKVFRDGKEVKLNRLRRGNFIKYDVPEVTTMQYPARFNVSEIYIQKLSK